MGVSSSNAVRKVMLGAWQRVLYGVLGAVLVLGGAGLSWILLQEALWPTRPGTQPVALGCFGVLFALVAAWGVILVWRGARGFRVLSERALRHDQSARRLISLLEFFVLPVCALVLYRMSHGRPWTSLSYPGPLALAWYFCMTWFWLPLGVVLHELGHLAVGVGLGFTWTTLRMGPLEIHPAGTSPRVRWNTEGLELFRGIVHFERGQAHGAPRRFAWVVLGGAAANLLAALLHGLTARALGGATPFEARGLSAFVWAGALCHGVLTLTNLLPRRLATGASDGEEWRRLRRMRPDGDAPPAVRIQEEFMTRRPREWSLSVDALREAAAGANTDPEVAATLRLYALARLLDEGEVSAARTLLGSLGPDIAPSPTLRREFLLQHALIHALEMPDPSRARARFVEACQHDGSQPLYSRLAEAAVLLSEGRPTEARESLAAWEAAARALGCRQEWSIGNLWALERLHAALGLGESRGQD